MIDYQLQNGVAVVRMDDGKANALTHELMDAVTEAVARAEREASAVVLAGRAERFSAGFDLRVMTSGYENMMGLVTHGARFLLGLYGAKLPLVIACTGHAVAAGVLVVLTGDVRVGAAGMFKLGLNEVAIGMPVPVLAMELARDRLLPTELGRATLTAAMYAPDDAVRAGWLDEVVPADQVIARATEEAARLGKLPKPAFAATKERLRGRTIDLIRTTFEADVRALTIPSR